jgi:MoaA/NifB/PqqE/SkfB family radical SAM enzyme
MPSMATNKPRATGTPSSVCVRVTRACNAHCGFCLAPPTAHQVRLGDLVRGLEWLAQVGVSKIQLCGGEPTIRRDLPEIIGAVHRLGFACSLTTNGILLRPEVLEHLQLAKAAVKVSVHGPEALHNAMLGRDCYQRVTQNIRALREADVQVAMQTVITRRLPDAYRYTIELCRELGVKKLTLMPFVPRGRGVENAGEYQLSAAQRTDFFRDVRAVRNDPGTQLDVHIVDLWTRDYYVVETNGELTIQRETDAADGIVASVW